MGRHVRWVFAMWLGALLLAGCATTPPGPTPAQVRADIARRIPASVSDRDGWATDIQVAFEAQALAPNPENICAVLAVTEQESTYTADPAVSGLSTIARAEIERGVGGCTAAIDERLETLLALSVEDDGLVL